MDVSSSSTSTGGLSVIPANFAHPAPKSATYAEHGHGHSHKASLASALSHQKKSKKTPRRPHTSAGPRDNSNNLSEFRREAGLYERKRPSAGHLCPHEVIATSEVVVDGGGSVSALTTALSSFVKRRTVTPRLSPSGNSSTSSLRNSANENEEAVPDRSRMQAIENELSRIDVQSRRSSIDILGIFKRKRVFGDRDG